MYDNSITTPINHTNSLDFSLKAIEDTFIIMIVAKCGNAPIKHIAQSNSKMNKAVNCKKCWIAIMKP